MKEYSIEELALLSRLTLQKCWNILDYLKVKIN